VGLEDGRVQRLRVVGAGRMKRDRSRWKVEPVKKTKRETLPDDKKKSNAARVEKAETRDVVQNRC
jgi:hypothetical protein